MNRRLDKRLAELMLGQAALRDLLSKMATAAAMRKAGAHLLVGNEIGERETCEVLWADRASLRNRSRRGDDGALRTRRVALAHERRRLGYRTLHVLLRREGWGVHKRRVQRIDRAEN